MKRSLRRLLVLFGIIAISGGASAQYGTFGGSKQAPAPQVTSLPVSITQIQAPVNPQFKTYNAQPLQMQTAPPVPPPMPPPFIPGPGPIGGPVVAGGGGGGGGGGGNNNNRRRDNMDNDDNGNDDNGNGNGNGDDGGLRATLAQVQGLVDQINQIPRAGELLNYLSIASSVNRVARAGLDAGVIFAANAADTTTRQVNNGLMASAVENYVSGLQNQAAMRNAAVHSTMMARVMSRQLQGDEPFLRQEEF
eukprot:GILI01016649.1.p1 GENE.GILI01016649.1~~GILI01016649.1.p1  ORF type:complete len:249 (-),score=100.43 GILI01016649.1:112-858(-)